VPDRALTDLELALVSPMLRRGIGEFATAWRPHIELRPELAAMESDPDFVRIAAPSDAVIVNRFRLELTTPHPTDPTTLTICYPYSMLQPVLESTDGSTIGASGSTPQVRAQVAERLAQSPIQLSVQFEPKRLSGLEILNLRPGDVLALPHSSEAPLTVFAGDVPVLEVQPTRKGSRVAARVTRMIGDPSTLRSRDLAGATSTTRREGGR
jgi:flagellar motor switch protein FliM